MPEEFGEGITELLLDIVEKVILGELKHPRH
jgi:hypothetical protein